jgi:putative Mn2+ efflux pump MntP
MSALSTAVLAFSLSTDAFAVALGKGAALRRPRLLEAIRTGAIFGSIEGAMPIAGWLLGLAASRYISAVDHWIAFIILALLGGKMVKEAFDPQDEGKAKPRRHGLGVLILAAIGTSIDALAVGMTLAIMGFNIWLNALAIGCATCLMVTIGIMAGHQLGRKTGRYAEVLGGIGLWLVGTWILYEHIGA